MYLFHYYDKDIGPFVNLSDLPMYEAILHKEFTKRMALSKGWHLITW